MAIQNRELVWKTPYKPAHASEAGPSREFLPPQRPTPTLLPLQTQSAPAAANADTQFTFQFPRRSFLPASLRPNPWPSLNRLLPLLPNMSDPTTVHEVGPHEEAPEKLRGPGVSSYTFPSFLTACWNQAEKQKMIASLRNHSVNTLAELRRIERVFATMGTSDLTEPMTTAWQYYVNSHMLLTELRSLTRNYPFSSDCLDEAKRRVLVDPDSNRSWNYCWLVLTKIQSDNLIPWYAQQQAALPVMWGNQNPSQEGREALSAAFLGEWNYALNQMLRHWETPPVGRESSS